MKKSTLKKIGVGLLVAEAANSYYQYMFLPHKAMKRPLLMTLKEEIHFRLKGGGKSA